MTATIARRVTAVDHARAADLLIVDAEELLTCAGFSATPARGSDQGRIGVISGGSVAIAGDTILAVGPTAELRRAYPVTDDRIVDARGKVVLPGFVDPHTHLVFGGHRAAEWEQRMAGKPYLDILREGGGILNTVRATRAASFDELLAAARRWARRAIACGTTTLEAKSGYALDHDGELELLEVVAALSRELPIELVPTFLGAHVVPAEFRERRSEYLDAVERTQAEARSRQLAEFADVFCEEEAFTVDETKRLLGHARGLGLGVKLHAEQFTASGAVALGLELGATSIDHLEHIGDADVAAWSRSGRPPVGVLLPGVPFHLGLERHAPARRLIDAGVPVALATDFNPGSSFTPSMPMAIALACRSLGLSVAEAIVASTINAAHALGRGAVTGSLEPGKRADLIVCDAPDHRFLGYAFGFEPVSLVIARGQRVLERS
jgi:imidazolonepropionase